MEKQPGSIESLLESMNSYIETRIELLRLKAVDKSADIISSLMSLVILSFILFLFLLMLSTGCALVIGHLLGRYYLGFFIIAGVYIIIGLVLYLSRRRWPKKPVGNTIVQELLK